MKKRRLLSRDRLSYVQVDKTIIVTRLRQLLFRKQSLKARIWDELDNLKVD